MSAVALINALLVLVIMLALAAAWGKDRRNVLVHTLIYALLLSIALIRLASPGSRLGLLTAVDGLVVVIMGHFARQGSQRARAAMIVGCLKVLFTVLAYEMAINQHVRAGGRNVGFIIQIIVAGGFADGLLAWLADRLRDAADLRDRVLARLGAR